MGVTLKDIKAAAIRIQPFIHNTPVLTCSTLNRLTQAELYFKCENFQKGGAFKIRGASNAVFQLPDDIAIKGVATHSSGNHAQALSLAARTRDIPAYIVMPNDSARVKVEAVKSYGGKITFCEPNMAARQATLEKIIKETGASFIHPYDNEHIIAGQGTLGMEFIRENDPLDLLIVPVGGGGLIAGISVAIAAISPHTQVIGAEPALVDDAYQSFKAGKLLLNLKQDKSICDGLLTPIGTKTFPIIQAHVSDIYTATEEYILQATQYIWERMKVVVEPSAAISLAIILQHPEFFRGKKIGLILSGGNVDIKTISQLL